MIAGLIADRTHFGMSDHELHLFRRLDTMTPGEFRRMMKLVHWHAAGADEVLTRENQPLDRLYYVLDGAVTIDKAGHRIPVDPGVFIGEVAFLLTRTASATVTVAEGTRYVSWDAGALRRLLIRAPSLRIAFDAALNRDMAGKVARASG